MIKSLRKKFVQTAMLSVLAVLILLVTAINIVYYVQNKQARNDIFDLVRDISQSPFNPGGPREDRFPEAPVQPMDPLGDMRDNSTGRNMPFSVGYCIVYLDENFRVSEIDTERVPFLDDDTAEQYADEILSSNKPEGWIDNYCYRLYEDTDLPVLIILEGAVIRSSSRLVLLVSAGVAAISYLLIFAMVVLFSKRATKPLAESYKKQKQFITDAGHELKTPLTVISANTTITRMDLGDHEGLDAIDKQTNKMQDLILNLVSLSKMDEEQNQLAFQVFSISDAVYDTAMTYKNLAKQKGRYLQLELDKNLTYRGDESSIRQIVSILLDNALKYGDEDGEIAITLRGGKTIILTVSNPCSNMDKIALDRVFDRFYRADKSRASESGYGLGLSIAKAVAERHGGSIKAYADDHRINFEVRLK